MDLGADYSYRTLLPNRGFIKDPLFKGLDQNKDQTYFLAAIDGSALERSFSPSEDLRNLKFVKLLRSIKFLAKKRTLRIALLEKENLALLQTT